MTTPTKPFEEMNTIAKQIKDQALVATDDYFKFLKEDDLIAPCKRFGSW